MSSLSTRAPLRRRSSAPCGAEESELLLVWSQRNRSYSPGCLTPSSQYMLCRLCSAPCGREVRGIGARPGCREVGGPTSLVCILGPSEQKPPQRQIRRAYSEPQYTPRRAPFRFGQLYSERGKRTCVQLRRRPSLQYTSPTRLRVPTHEWLPVSPPGTTLYAHSSTQHSFVSFFVFALFSLSFPSTRSLPTAQQPARSA